MYDSNNNNTTTAKQAAWHLHTSEEKKMVENEKPNYRHCYLHTNLDNGTTFSPKPFYLSLYILNVHHPYLCHFCLFCTAHGLRLVIIVFFSIHHSFGFFFLCAAFKSVWLSWIVKNHRGWKQIAENEWWAIEQAHTDVEEMSGMQKGSTIQQQSNQVYDVLVCNCQLLCEDW